MLPEAFFEDGGEPGRFVATTLTRGPWSNAHQHGGPPAALMARAIEGFGDDAVGVRVARLTVELMRPIPIGPVRVEVVPDRVGRKAQWLSAALRDDAGQLLASARAVRIARRTVELPPPKDPPASPLPPPDASVPFEFPFFRADIGYHRAVEVRIARGRWSREPTAAWLRPVAPLLRDEPDSPLVRLTIVADAANGVAIVLDARRYAFVNPDLTIAMWRDPTGEWIGLDTHATAHASGGGLCHAALHDVAGPIGHSVQTLVIEAVQ